MLTWRPPTYNGDRHLARCGSIDAGAVFDPMLGRPNRWPWRYWLGETVHPAEGVEKTLEAAKAAVVMRHARFLELAGLQSRAQVTEE